MLKSVLVSFTLKFSVKFLKYLGPSNSYNLLDAVRLAYCTSESFLNILYQIIHLNSPHYINLGSYIVFKEDYQLLLVSVCK